MSKKLKPSWWDEFITFAVKGNAMALAVGTIIGGAFGTVSILEKANATPLHDSLLPLH